MPVLLLAGGLAVGLLAQLTDGSARDWQETLFSGQSAVPELVAEGSVGIVLLVLTTKSIGYAICLGCGFRGGPVFPAIFLGVGVATIPVIVFDMSPTLAVAIGTAAGHGGGHAAAVRVRCCSPACSSARRASTRSPPPCSRPAAAWLTMQALDKRAETKLAQTGAGAAVP